MLVARGFIRLVVAWVSEPSTDLLVSARSAQRPIASRVSLAENKKGNTTCINICGVPLCSFPILSCHKYIVVVFTMDGAWINISVHWLVGSVSADIVDSDSVQGP